MERAAPSLRLWASEGLEVPKLLLSPFQRAVPIAPGRGQPVVVYPGYLTSDVSSIRLRRSLSNAGYAAYGWQIGRNKGARVDLLDRLGRHLAEVTDRHGGPAALVGWSLGGVFARELAKLHPDAVRLVISLGSPIHDDRRHTNASRLFEFLNGKDPEPIKHGRFTGLDEAPPVPTTSILTRTDGIVHWRGSVQHPHKGHEQIENIEVHASHCGLGVNPSVMVAIADRLKQPEGEWQPFAPRLSQRWMFPQGNVH